MRFAVATLFVMLTAAALAQSPEPPALATAVNAAVEDFQPLEPPPRGRLRGWVIGIDPAGADLSRPGGRLHDDLSLITAAHLYHFVQHAGGKPVLTRADHTRVADAGRAGILAEAGCEVCVSIRHDAVGENVLARRESPELHSRDALLCAKLSAALGYQLAEPRKAGPSDTSFVEALGQLDGMSDVAFSEVHLESPAGISEVGPPLRRICFENARRLYEGISGYCSEPRRPDGSDKRAPNTIASDDGDRCEQLVSSIWPAGRLPDERLDWFCRKYVGESITNQSLVYFDVTPHAEDGVLVLRGGTNVPMLTAGLVRALRAAGFEQVSDLVRALPDRTRLGERLFGVCRAPMALTHQRPAGDGWPQTQLLFGEPVFLLDLKGESYLLHAGDGYWGWVHRDAVEPMTARRFDAYMSRPSGAVLRDLEDGRARIPRGSRVRLLPATGGQRAILLPDGSTLNVPTEAVAPLDTEDSQAAARVRAALDMLYTPYVFGGRSPLGLDCSGLASNVWSRTGVTLPRDARQQAPAGRLVATSWHRANIHPGDQLFFIDESGKIYHTGIALDAVHVIHATAPCVQIGSFDPHDRLYDEELDRSFFMVKRP